MVASALVFLQFARGILLNVAPVGLAPVSCGCSMQTTIHIACPELMSGGHARHQRGLGQDKNAEQCWSGVPHGFHVSAQTQLLHTECQRELFSPVGSARGYPTGHGQRSVHTRALGMLG